MCIRDRISAAIALAQANQPPITKADAADWLEDRLARPQSKGVTRIVYHSIVLQYVTPEGRARIGAAMQQAGASATKERPLAWLSYECPSVAPTAELRLTLWPDGENRLLGQAHPHGAVIDWVG